MPTRAGLLAVLAAGCSAPPGAPPTIHVAGSERVEIVGLGSDELAREDWTEVLTVRVASGDPDVPAMLGEFHVEGDVLTFVPRYPLRAGVAYEVVLVAGDGLVVHDFTLPEPAAGPPTVVTAVHPGGRTCRRIC